MTSPLHIPKFWSKWVGKRPASLGLAPLSAKLEQEISTLCSMSGSSMFDPQPRDFAVSLLVEYLNDKGIDYLIDLFLVFFFYSSVIDFNIDFLTCCVFTICVCFVSSACLFKYAQV